MEISKIEFCLLVALKSSSNMPLFFRKLTNYQLALREGKRRFNAQRTGQEEGGSEVGKL